MAERRLDVLRVIVEATATISQRQDKIMQRADGT